jgi:hypothetical protein
MMFEKPIPVQKKVSFLDELKKFIEYVDSFYNIKTGVYPIATLIEIEAAVGQYLTDPHTIDIQFDSIDRETVRTILEPTYSPI